MLFNKDIVAFSCKICLKYIFKPEHRVPVTDITNQRIVEVTNFKRTNEHQKFICCQCDKKLIEFVKFRTEAITNMERINELIESFMSESDDEEVEIENNDSEEKIEEETVYSRYPYKKIFYEENEYYSSNKRKISEDEQMNEGEYSIEPLAKKLTAEGMQIQNFEEIKQLALSSDAAFKTFLTEMCRYRRGANKTWKLMIFCGFKNKGSFMEKFKNNLTHEDAIQQMQTVIDRSSRAKLKKIGMKKTAQKFNFNSFQIQIIKDIFNAVEELICNEMIDNNN